MFNDDDRRDDNSLPDLDPIDCPWCGSSRTEPFDDPTIAAGQCTSCGHWWKLDAT
jgi:hypothetical protein